MFTLRLPLLCYADSGYTAEEAAELKGTSGLVEGKRSVAKINSVTHTHNNCASCRLFKLIISGSSCSSWFE